MGIYIENSVLEQLRDWVRAEIKAAIWSSQQEGTREIVDITAEQEFMLLKALLQRDSES